MNRYFSSFSIAVVIYISIISVYLYLEKPINSIHTEQIKSKQIVKFTMIEEIPEIVKKEIIKEPTAITKKKEIIEKKVEKPKKVKKIVKRVEPKKKEVKKKEPNEKIKKIVKKTELKKEKRDHLVKKKQIKQIKVEKSFVKKEINTLNDLKNKKIKQEKYYTQIKQMINKNKSYPKVAVRRGIEGEIKIKFCISQKGELLSYEIIEGKKVFHTSIVKAIQKSFPIIPPKDVLSENLDLALTVQYRLY